MIEGRGWEGKEGLLEDAMFRVKQGGMKTRTRRSRIMRRLCGGTKLNSEMTHSFVIMLSYGTRYKRLAFSR